MIINKSPIVAADEDFDDFEGFDDTEEMSGEDKSLEDTLDDIQDGIDDIQDDIDDIQEDDPNIYVDNNIGGHYIAECDRCHEIFISAVIESDHELSSVKGTCPVCGKESEQLLKWIIKDVE